jgi:hypothetical protein
MLKTDFSTKLENPMNDTNAFDALAIAQQKARDEAASYEFFIRAGFISDQSEILKLYQWFDQDWSVRDRNGRTRLRLLSQISDVALSQIVVLEGLIYQPVRLRSEIRRRLGL